MTQTPPELGLSAAAEARLAAYLVQVRAALAGVPDVSPDEIEADIREHVENELRAAVRPIAPFVLEAVLRRLGPPTQWLPAGRTGSPSVEIPSLFGYLRYRMRGVLGAVWRGPEDWRLPYLSFAVFALGVLAFPLFPLFLLVSYILSRAGLAVVRERGLGLDTGRKWLLYPPVVIVSVALLGLTLLAPFGVTAAICGSVADADRNERWELAGRPRLPAGHRGGWTSAELMKRYPDVITTLDRLLTGFPGNRHTKDVLAVGFVGIGVLAAWWTAFGLLGAKFPGAVRAVFAPLCDGFGGRAARQVGLTGLLLLAVWCGFAVRLLVDAGVV